MDPVLKVYADALLQIGKEKGEQFLEELVEEQGFLGSLLGQNQARYFFESPEISKDLKLEAIDEVFRGRCTDVTRNYLKVLVTNGRQFLIRDIAKAFEELYLEHKHRIKVFINSAVQVEADDLRELQFVVEDLYDRDAMFVFKEQPELLGGLIVRVGDVQIDGSVKGRLVELRQKMLASKVPSEVLIHETETE